MALAGTPGQPAAAPALGLAPERAIRARVTAIVIDSLIVGTAGYYLIPAIGIRGAGADLVAFPLLLFLYFFLQEAEGGKTLGKRVAKIRVVTLGGQPPGVKHVA